MNFNSANNDKTHWDRPEEFRPQRFLDENGKFRQLPAAMPFGFGNFKIRTALLYVNCI